MNKEDKEKLKKAIPEILCYLAWMVLVLGLVFTFVDVLQMPIVQNYIEGEFWHSMALMAVSLYVMFRLNDWYLYKIKKFFRQNSYESTLEKENDALCEKVQEMALEIQRLSEMIDEQKT